jgi:hypothetical protein
MNEPSNSRCRCQNEGGNRDDRTAAEGSHTEAAIQLESYDGRSRVTMPTALLLDMERNDSGPLRPDPVTRNGDERFVSVMGVSYDYSRSASVGSSSVARAKCESAASLSPSFSDTHPIKK